MTKRAGRLGRPSRVTSDDIVRVALELGIDNANIRSVAEALGMSVPGVYHHVRTRGQLRDMITEWWLKRLLAMLHREGSFEELLQAYAQDLFQLTSNYPEMIDHIRAGRGMGEGRLAPHLEQIIGHGVRCGFTAEDAFDIFSALTGSALGAAVVEASARVLRKSSAPDDLRRAVSSMKNPPGREEVSLLIDSNSPKAYRSVELTMEGLRACYGARLSLKPPPPAH
jgi:AcrR family transcriptional regulator